MNVDRQYFAADSRPDSESRRLGLFEEMLDPLTLSRIGALNLRPGAQCLLVGTGRGSIAATLSDLVGKDGHIVATDRDARFFGVSRLRGVEFRQHNILDDPLEVNRFDLVHCRGLLMHLREPSVALDKMVASLKPGGWLLSEEPDDTSFGPASFHHPDARLFAEAYRRLLKTLVRDGAMDPYFGRRLFDLLLRPDLTNVACEGVTCVRRGGDINAKLILETLALHVQAGRCPQSDAATIHRALSDPGFTFMDGTWFGARGQRV